MKIIFAFFCFVILMMLIVTFGQDQPQQVPEQPWPTPAHRSAITPPPVPDPSGEIFVRRAPSNLYFIHVPHGRMVETVKMGNLQLEEIADVYRTNRYNVWLISMKPVEVATGEPMLSSNQSALEWMKVSPEDAYILSNFHKADSRVIIVPK